MNPAGLITIYNMSLKNKFVPVAKNHVTMGSGGEAPTTADLGTRIVCTKYTLSRQP
jgi:hypothetical protein